MYRNNEYCFRELQEVLKANRHFEVTLISMYTIFIDSIFNNLGKDRIQRIMLDL